MKICNLCGKEVTERPYPNIFGKIYHSICKKREEQRLVEEGKFNKEVIDFQKNFYSSRLEYIQDKTKRMKEMIERIKT